jgi:uncharacterized membrane protein YphA (DoxX/SURF4 family)
MKIVALICRILLGLMFIVFGSNILHDFMHMPHPPAGTQAAAFFGLFAPTGWIKVVGVFQVLGGLLVLLGRTTPLGLCLLAPVIFNILCFHLLLGVPGILPGAVAALLEVVLIYAYRDNFAGIFTYKATPTI